MLENVSRDLAQAVAMGLGMTLPDPMPRALKNPPAPEVDRSPALSLLSRPGDGSIRTRRVAIIVADGVEGDSVRRMHAELLRLGAGPRFVGTRLGAVSTTGGDPIDVEVTTETTPAVLYDALVLPDGADAVVQLANLGQALEFIKDQFRHCKPIVAFGASETLLEGAGASPFLPSGEPDPGVLLAPAGFSKEVLSQFVEAIGRHRHFERYGDPPPV